MEVEKDDGMINTMPLANRLNPVHGDWVERERKKEIGVCVIIQWFMLLRKGPNLFEVLPMCCQGSATITSSQRTLLN